MIGTAFWYLATDQWRYDGLPGRRARVPARRRACSPARTTADLPTSSPRSDGLDAEPTRAFNRNPLELVDEPLEAAGKDPAADYVVRRAPRVRCG